MENCQAFNSPNSGRMQDKNSSACELEGVIAFDMVVEAEFPEVVQTFAALDATQCQYVLNARLGPEHPRLFASLADDGLATGLDQTRSVEVALFAEGPVLHALDVLLEVAQLFFHRPGLSLALAGLAGFFDRRLHLVPELAFGPAMVLFFVIGLVPAAQGIITHEN